MDLSALERLTNIGLGKARTYYACSRCGRVIWTSFFLFSLSFSGKRLNTGPLNAKQ